MKIEVEDMSNIQIVHIKQTLFEKNREENPGYAMHPIITRYIRAHRRLTMTIVNAILTHECTSNAHVYTYLIQ